jgi:hypothetical protein
VPFRTNPRIGHPIATSHSVRIARIVAVLMMLAGVVFGAESPKDHPYRKRWKRSVVGKGAVGRVVAGAAINQARNHPSKYGGGISGFGKRVGAGFASNAVGKTVEHGVAAKLHEDLDYHRSNKKGVGPRLGYALKSTVVTHNTRTGKATPATGRIAGHAASGAFTQGVLAAGSGASTAGIGLAADAGANVVREFVPRKKKPPKKRQ